MKMETTVQLSVKDKIATEAFKLFCRRGIKGSSMDDIAQHLSMSKKTIYKWFSNKDEIVYWAINSYLSSVDADCERCRQEAPNAIEELFSIMKTTRQVFASIHPGIFFDLQKYHANAWQKWQEYKNHDFLHRIKDNLRRGISEGLFRQDLDVEVIARLRLAQIEVPFDETLFPRFQFELLHVQTASLEYFMLGIATLKGHKMINDYKQITEEE
ncbi:TetR/AcrR family transcriptional regulator [Pontibacter sp. BAB1700]|uniref:Transcriptional regulator, TetR family n=2 Tax=Pontibacter lucknowensis TaxID=1077936 RepID=A0A1N6U8D7_9BACT|nr:TetR/AcrR family transcriptional regulator [Pontibacter sp. BAB1700]EJF11804.1 TetR family transcriptional regulator [Pontibacter sp. BAB1700]SIQ61948.1 transcriptional regulator, TetR family [Pontibacter lucknowensis]